MRTRTRAEALTLVAGDLVRRARALGRPGVRARRVAQPVGHVTRQNGPCRPPTVVARRVRPRRRRPAVHDLPLGSDPDVLAGVAAVLRWADGPVRALDRVRAVSDGPVRSLARAIEADLLLDASGEAAARDAAQSVVDDATADPTAREIAAAVRGAREGLDDHRFLP